MKPYPAYKDSGIEWIGAIPEHWDVRKLKGISERTIVGIAEAATHAYTDNGIPIIRSTNIKNSKIEQNNLLFINEELAESNHSRYLKTNDLLTVRTGDAGATAVVPKELENSHCFTMLISTLKHNYDSYYYSYYLNCHCAAVYFDFSSWGTAQKNISVPILQNCPILTLPYKEQIEITRYINRKTSQIDTLIEKKQKQIELLKEERTAIINQAVTKGLNPDVPMKDSGIEWLGEVPEHWEIKRLKYLAHINPTKSSCDYSQNSDELVTFLPMEKVSEEGDVNSEIKKPINELWNGFTYFRENDIIVAKITPCFENGKGAILRNLGSKIGFGSTEFHVIHPRVNQINQMFLYYATRTHIFKKLGEASMTGAAGQKRVPSSFIENYFVGVPKVLDEQQSIVNYIEKESDKMSQIIQTAEKQISFLQEYRTALISNAVTGKIDVRGEEGIQL